MDADDKKNLYKLIIVITGIAIIIGAQYLPILIVDPKLISLLGIGTLLAYRYMKPIILKHTGITKEEFEDIEEDLSEITGAKKETEPKPAEPTPVPPS